MWYNFITIILIAALPLLALYLDGILGEPRRFHPLVGFGNLAIRVESKLNHYQQMNELVNKVFGVFAWVILCLPITLLSVVLLSYLENWVLYFLFQLLILYLAIGFKSLVQHAKNVVIPLGKKDMKKARQAVSMMVSRNTEELNESEVSRATIESVLENGNDAIIASLFWFIIGGAPLVILHRLVNTLDAMWGYRNERFNSFGWFSARMDDLMAWPSAKIASILYLLVARMTNFFDVLSNVNEQAKLYKSTNGGWTIAAGAYALGIRLGGRSTYQDKSIFSDKSTIAVYLGEGREPKSVDIHRGNTLVSRAVWLFAIIYCLSYCIVFLPLLDVNFS